MTRICDIENIREPMEEDFVKICHDDNSEIQSFEVTVFTHESKKRFLYETISDYLNSRHKMYLFFNFKKPCYFIQNVRTMTVTLDVLVVEQSSKSITFVATPNMRDDTFDFMVFLDSVNNSRWEVYIVTIVQDKLKYIIVNEK